MATYTKEFFSGSVNGKQIKLTGNDTANAVTIHQTGTSNTVIDEMWIYATTNTVATMYLEFGGATDPDDIIPISMDQNRGLYICVPGLPLSGNGSATSNIRAYASIANVVMVSGYVNRITP